MVEGNAPKNAPPWRTILFDGHVKGFAQAADDLFRIGFEPACRTLALELENSPRGETPASIDYWERQRLAQLEMHRSFALGLGGLWERNFRRHLAHSAIILAQADKQALEIIKKAQWQSLCKIFLDVRKFSLVEFSQYEVLHLLFRVVNATRHGDGTETESLYNTHNHLFMEHDVRSGWHAYFSLGGEPPSSIYKLEITLEQLTGFRDAVVGFWLAVDQLAYPRS